MPQTVYVVEDDSGIRNVVEMILSEAGYEVKAFENFKGLKSQLQLGLPDLILMDMTLHDGSGIAFCEELKSAVSTARIPVIMMSAHFFSDPETEIPCADGFISKPFDIVDLLTVISKNVG